MALQKIIKAGNSLAVTIPSDLVKVFGLKPGDNVDIERDLDNPAIKYKFFGSHQLSLASELPKKTS